MNETLSIFILIIIGICTQFLVSWAGSVLHSIGSEETKYAVFTFNDDRYEPMTTNILMNVCIPNVVMIFIFMIARKFDFSYINKNLIISTISFFVWRMIWICLFLRRKEMYNWLYELSMAVAGIGLSYFLTLFFFTTEQTVFISASELREELWFVIIVVLYKFFKMILDKKVTQNDILTKNQMINYIRHKFNVFYNKYGNLLDIDKDNRYVCILLFAVMIFEDYNRGPIIRKLERLALTLHLKNKATIGIMQFPTEKNISDEKSIISFYDWVLLKVDNEKQFHGNDMFINNIVWQYNNDTRYGESVAYIYNRLYEYIDEVPKLRNDFCLREKIEYMPIKNNLENLAKLVDADVIPKDIFNEIRDKLSPYMN